MIMIEILIFNTISKFLLKTQILQHTHGFLSYLAVFEISSAKEHIFDSCKCITYLLGWVLSKISKKPYLYRTGIDMVFSIFSSSNFHGRTQMYSG